MAIVGIVGVGRMGRAMWSRLTDRGFDTIVYDVAPGARDGAAQAGAKVAASLEEVAANARTVVLSLPRSDDVEAAVLGDAGLAAGLTGGGATAGPATVLDTTSGRPAVSRRVGAALAARRRRLPRRRRERRRRRRGGGHAEADDRRGRGGRDPLRRRCSPRSVTSRWHCGAVGAGHAMKTVLNLAAQTKLMAEMEALLLGTAAGLDRRSGRRRARARGLADVPAR